MGGDGDRCPDCGRRVGRLKGVCLGCGAILEPPAPNSPEPDEWAVEAIAAIRSRKRESLLDSRLTRRVLLYVTLGIGVAALLGAVAYWYFVATVAVPDLTGLTAAEAAVRLKAVDLTTAPTVYDQSAPDRPGTIVAQDPEAGAHAFSGGAVTITVAGAEILTVPRVTGLDERASAVALEDAGFTKGPVSSVFDSTATLGTVVGQTPLAGTEAALFSEVSLLISKGKDMRAVPDVLGMKRADAEKALSDAGLTTKVTTVESTKMASGLVMSQSIAGGDLAEVGTLVALQVAASPPPVVKPPTEVVQKVTVPNVVGMKQRSAERAIRNAGLVPRDVWNSGSDPGDLFREYCYAQGQSPRGGALVAKGSVVRIYLVWY